MSDGAMIILMFALLIFVPLICVFTVLGILRARRKRKNETYTGTVQGRVLDIVDKGLDHPWVIHVIYDVNGVGYSIRETAKLKSETIKAGPIPIGQRKTFVMGPVSIGDRVTVKYDVNDPQKAIIAGNDGVMTS